jgi:hypothetical protein
VAVSHWGIWCLTHRLSRERPLVQDSTRVCKQCRKVAGLHRWTRDGRIVRCVDMRSGCVAVGVAIGTSVVGSIGAVSLTSSQCLTHGIRWRPCATCVYSLSIEEMWKKVKLISFMKIITHSNR